MTDVVLPPTAEITDADTPAPGRSRRNRGSEVVRDALLNAAIREFASRGFDGASTRRIAEAAGAHQSQIRYHFDSKDELWKRCVERLIGELDTIISQAFDGSDGDPRATFEASIRGLVRFMARWPELNRIMLHEATSETPRLIWLVQTHLASRHEALTDAWSELASAGLVASIDPDLLYHSLIGAASLFYSNAPEAMLLGIDPTDPSVIDRHADALVALFLTPPAKERA